MTVSTALPTIPASIRPLVLMPTMHALCASESKYPARASPASGCWPPRRPDDRVAGSPRSTPSHWAAVLRVRAHEHADLRELRPDGGEPAADELDLVGCDERRGAEVEDVRLRRVEPDLRCEVLARRARRPVEPVVEALRAGEDDPVAPGSRASPRAPAAGCRSRRRRGRARSAAGPCRSGCPSSRRRCPVRIPSARAAFRYSTCDEANSITGLASTASGLLARRGTRRSGGSAGSRPRAREPRDRLPRELGVGAGRQARDPLVQRPLEGLRQAAVVDPPVELVDEAAAEGRRVGVARVAVAGEVGQRAHEPADAPPAVAAARVPARAST